MTKGAFLISLATLWLAAPANAQYVYDPADLPEGFTCYEGPDAKPCDVQKREEAWYEVYGERFDFWLESMLFRTDIYFAQRVGALPELKHKEVLSQLESSPSWTSNLIDAHYDIQLRRFGDWAFAINEDAQLRLVRYKAKEEIDPELAKEAKAMLPTTLKETAENLQIGAAFEDADLTQCNGSIAHLLSFPAQDAKPLWDTKELPFAPDFAPEEPDENLTITLDGAGVYVRTRGVIAPGETAIPQVSYREFNGGAVYDWTLKMYRIIQPCLRTSKATPPWKKFVEAEERMAAKAIKTD